ncbi:hypothetical protein E2C01_014968 [Portunus trituberculatus]|uniref:Uncharacterized protein n=1 Tax=Portunus trituberculatus TaxID=210409 RepID=A0A5B7DLP8_PORTR|nr:hypothetical protein [Portunus trituberculatus]
MAGNEVLLTTHNTGTGDLGRLVKVVVPAPPTCPAQETHLTSSTPWAKAQCGPFLTHMPRESVSCTHIPVL